MSELEQRIHVRKALNEARELLHSGVKVELVAKQLQAMLKLIGGKRK